MRLGSGMVGVNLMAATFCLAAVGVLAAGRPDEGGAAQVPNRNGRREPLPVLPDTVFRLKWREDFKIDWRDCDCGFGVGLPVRDFPVPVNGGLAVRDV